jgi:hypothetical protein
VTHEEAWARLPDLLDDRDDPALLAHVRGCADCQRQLFRLGRVDRLLRDSTAARGQKPPRGLGARPLLAAAAAVAAATAATLALLVPNHAPAHAMMLWTAAGQPVGRAVMGHSDTRNLSLALTAQRLPVDHGQVFVLWAGDNTRSRMEVGRFMVDRRGGCRVRFNLPATHRWGRFWITRPGTPAAIVAST